MTRNAVFALFLSVLAASVATAQWQIPTPREQHAVPSDGTTVNYPTVSLPIGVRYHIHSEGRVQVSSSGDIADACYYVNVFPFGPNVVPVSAKVRLSGTQESWMYDLLSPQSYQSSHTYDVGTASQGSPLSVRFFDRSDPPNAYYNDNSGSLTVEVAQETPMIVAKYDTVRFGNIPVGKNRTLEDSIEAYGTEGYRCDGVSLSGPSQSKFFVFSERTVPFGLQETTNEFRFTYTPTTIQADTAYLRLVSSNAYLPQRSFVIVLIGNGIGSQLTVARDTLDFGTIRVNSTKNLTQTFRNAGSVDATIASIVVAPAGNFTASTTPIIVPGTGSAGCTVSFTPTSIGNFFTRFLCTTDDGSTLVFYAKGAGGIPSPYISSPVLDFGRLLMNSSKMLSDTILNKGTTDLNVVSTTNTNSFEYAVGGGQGPQSYPPGNGARYTFTFTPRVHIPFWGNHDGSFTFNFDDGTSKTIVFKGCDHDAISTRLAIDTNYYVNVGNTIEVSQKLLDPLDSAFTPIRSLQERVSFDQQTFDFVSARKGALTASGDWTLTTTPGPGFIDIKLSATNSSFVASGSIVLLTFRAHPDAIPGQLTLLPQLSIDFANNFEPLVTSSSGRIIVSDMCTPVRLTNAYASKATYIEQTQPNPVVREALVNYTIGTDVGGTTAVPVRIRIFDQMGRLVQVAVNENLAAGRYSTIFTTTDLAPGMYWYTLDAGGVSCSRSMLVVR